MRTSKRILGLAAFVLLFTFCACSQNGRVENSSYDFVLNTLLDHSVQEIDVGGIEELGNSLRFIDARERIEFDVSHIENAIWVGYDDFEIKRVDNLNKEDTIVVYCSVGYRSEKISEQLEEAGYQNVWNLYGGIFEWKNQDKEVVDSDGEITNRVHAFDKNWGRWLREGDKVYIK